jgi:1-acyl-sn-glycerol-3-phosphate acyltransferase
MIKPGLLYRFLKIYVYLGLRLFYRRLTIKDEHNVPLSGPVIFAINHQNAFMDAIVIATSSRRNPWFLTRASVFQSATARYWLNKLQMIPIYRFRDGHANMKKNDEALETCKRLLVENNTILIFPEGNHDSRWTLRPLQKGIARIAFATEIEMNFKSDLKIVPVGLQYENYLNSWSDLLVSFGKPISVKDYKAIYEDNSAKAVNVLLEDLRQAMESLMVSIHNQARYDDIHKAIKTREGREKNLFKRLENDQKFLLSLKDDFVAREEKPTKSKSLNACVLGRLFYFASLIPHLINLGLINWVLKKFVKDHHWASSIKIAVLLFGAPVIYFVQALLIWSFAGFWPWIVIYLLLLPPTAFHVLKYRSSCLH